MVGVPLLPTDVEPVVILRPRLPVGRRLEDLTNAIGSFFHAALREFLAADLDVPFAEPVIELTKLRRSSARMRGVLHFRERCLPPRIRPQRHKIIVGVELSFSPRCAQARIMWMLRIGRGTYPCSEAFR